MSTVRVPIGILFFVQKTYESGVFNKLCFLNVNRQFNGAMVRT